MTLKDADKWDDFDCVDLETDPLPEIDDDEIIATLTQPASAGMSLAA